MAAGQGRGWGGAGGREGEEGAEGREDLRGGVADHRRGRADHQDAVGLQAQAAAQRGVPGVAGVVVLRRVDLQGDALVGPVRVRAGQEGAVRGVQAGVPQRGREVRRREGVAGPGLGDRADSGEQFRRRGPDRGAGQQAGGAEFGVQVVRVAPAGLDDVGEDRADPVGLVRAGGEVGGRADRAGAGDARDRDGAGPAGGRQGADLRCAAQSARGADQDVRGRVRGLADAEECEGGASGEGGRVPGQRVRGGVQDGGEGALAVVRGPVWRR